MMKQNCLNMIGLSILVLSVLIAMSSLGYTMASAHQLTIEVVGM